MTWAQRIKRVFGIDVSTWVHCGDAVRIVASIGHERTKRGQAMLQALLDERAAARVGTAEI